MVLLQKRAWVTGVLLLGAALHGQEDESKLLELLDRYEESRGGVLKLEALGAVEIEGMTQQQDQAFTFTVYKKRPDLIRYRMERGGEAVILGYDGRTPWKRVLREDGRATEILGPEESELLRREASLLDPMARALEAYSRELNYLGIKEDGDRRVHVVEVFGPWKARSIYHLDHETLDIVRCEGFDGRGGQIVETLFSDYREVDGYRFAFRIENRIDGETISVTRLSSIKVNPGVLNFYFRPPN